MPKIIVKDHKYYFKIRGLGGPKGDKGDTGPAGPQGPQGPYVNVVAGTTTTLPAGSSAQVTVNNIGNTSTLNFGIPQGSKGDKGDAGTPGAQGPRGFAATVNVGETTTGQPGTNASVVNAGNEHDAVLKFTIPRGDKGETGETGPQGPAGSVKSSVVTELPETGESDKYYLVYRDSEGGTIATTDGYAQVTNDENGGDLAASQLLGNAEQTTYSGKNLCPNPLEYGIYNESGAKSGSDTGSVRSTTQLKVAPSTQYIFSCNGAKINTWLYEYDANGAYISGTRRLISQTAFTTGSTTHFVTFFKGSDTGLTGYQLELGSTPTSYEPYVGGIPAPNPQFPMPISTVTGEQNIKVMGKNLLEIKNTTRTINGVTFTPNEDGSVTVDGTATYQISYPLNIDSATNYRTIHLPAGTYTISSNYPQSAGLGYFVQAQYGLIGAPSKYSVTQFTENGEMTVGAYIRVNQGATLDNVTFYPQLELGSTASPYEPYQGQSYEVNLGKNLFDVSQSLEYKWLSSVDGSLVGSLDKNIVSDYIRVKIGQPYTISGIGSLQFNVWSYDTSSSATGKTHLLHNSTTVRTITPDTNYIRFSVGGGNATAIKNDIQFEAGTQATSYAPYFTPIELAKVGNYQDRIYKNDGKWYIEKNVGKVVFNGSEPWYYQDAGTLTNRFALPVSSYGLASGAQGLCNNNEFVTSGVSADSQRVGIVTSTLYYRINKTTLASTSANDFKTWVASNNIVIYTALATPTTTEITNETLLLQLNFLASLYGGVNNISLVGTGAQGELTGNYVVYDKYNRHKVYIWSSDDNTWQIIVQ